MIIGAVDLPSQLAVHASQMYARNMEKLILHVVRDGRLALDRSDEIVRGMLIVHDGVVVHEAVAAALGSPARKELAA